ncbi:protein belonging to Uncharacterized protein family UPF0118, partial [human gut metagenome]
ATGLWCIVCGLHFSAGGHGASSHRQKIGVSPIAVLVSLYAGIRLFGVWGIIKGPLGFVLIYETYHSLARMYDRQREQEQQE